MFHFTPSLHCAPRSPLKYIDSLFRQTKGSRES